MSVFVQLPTIFNYKFEHFVEEFKEYGDISFENDCLIIKTGSFYKAIEFMRTKVVRFKDMDLKMSLYNPTK